jgi:SAM-dependent methyltransferase
MELRLDSSGTCEAERTPMERLKVNGVTILSDSLSEGVIAENEATDREAEKTREGLDKQQTVNEYIQNNPSLGPIEMEPVLESRLPPGRLRILDIGVGRGESSLFLASKGHEVVAIEPGPGFSETVAAAAEKFHLPVKVYRGVAEDIDRLDEGKFDAVFFTSSFHHCDDPLGALRKAYELLNKGGKIFLLAESYLRPWVSKKKYYWSLEHDPAAIGHYGGNEHIYYNWEYLNMLRKAAFVDAKTFPMAQISRPILRTERMLAERTSGHRSYSETAVFCRVLVFFISAHICRMSLIYNPLAKSSVLPTNFEAVRP